jgi:hypothetical protein
MSTCYTTREEKAKGKNRDDIKDLHARNAARKGRSKSLVIGQFSFLFPIFSDGFLCVTSAVLCASAVKERQGI